MSGAGGKPWCMGSEGVDTAKKDRLAIAGWRAGDPAEFLELTAEEAAFVELKLALADYLREVRKQQGWTQSQVATRLGSSQSRVAKMEAADSSVSLDLLVKSLLALGASRSEVGAVIAKVA
jgi:predicted XRE-type DNA-binding protein